MYIIILGGVSLMERIKIDETGNGSPEGMYILKQEVKRLKILSAFFIVISIITAFFDLSLKHHKK